MVTINSELYGERSEFATIEEAQATIRNCGPEFSGVVLGRGAIHTEDSEYDYFDVTNEDGLVVGMETID